MVQSGESGDGRDVGVVRGDIVGVSHTIAAQRNSSQSKLLNVATMVNRNNQHQQQQHHNTTSSNHPIPTQPLNPFVNQFPLLNSGVRNNLVQVNSNNIRPSIQALRSPRKQIIVPISVNGDAFSEKPTKHNIQQVTIRPQVSFLNQNRVNKVIVVQEAPSIQARQMTIA